MSQVHQEDKMNEPEDQVPMPDTIEDVVDDFASPAIFADQSPLPDVSTLETVPDDDEEEEL